MKSDRPKYKQIIEAAVEVIAENGFHASQVSKIAKKANVADGTIYLYFKNKEDILISVFKEKMGSFVDITRNAIQGQSSASEKLETFIHMHYHQLASNPDLAIVTQLELRQSKIELRIEINNILKDYLQIIDDILEQGIQYGEIRDDTNPQTLRRMLFGTLDEPVTKWVLKLQQYSFTKETGETHQLLTKGLFLT